MFPQLGLPEMIVVMGVAVLLFGKRLPEVGRSLGKGIIEFKKGLRGIEDEFHAASSETSHPHSYHRPEDRTFSHSTDVGVPKFEPPTQAPVPQEYAPQPYQD